MGRLPDYRRLLKEDFKEAPSWIDKLLSPVNSFFETVYEVLNRNITFGENVACQIKSMSFTTQSDYTSASPLKDGWEIIKFKSTLKTTAVGCVIMRIYKDTGEYDPITNAVHCDWYDNNGEITINYISGLADSTDYVVKFLVF